MARYEVLISFDERPDDPPHVLIIDAHSERGALAQFSRHRAIGRINRNLVLIYATSAGGQLTIPWGQAGNVTIGEVSLAAAAYPPTLAS